MSVLNLNRIFNPKRIAVIGASERKGSVGYTVLKNLISAGYDGVVYPVNPKREAIRGIQAYPDVASLPRPADLAVICVPAKFVPDIIRQCGEAGILGLVILTAGFKEAGEEGKQAELEIKCIAEQYPGMRIIGPNCLGVIVPRIGLNATFAADTPKSGGVAFISQSGALCTSVLDWALRNDMGFSNFVSIGNTIDVDLGDLIDYFGQDAATSAIILYAESITDVREFMSASRSFSRTKPIIAYKAGRFAESAKAAASHTGAMAGEDAVFDAVFARAGIVRVYDIDDMFECATLLARHKGPRGSRLAIVTNAGGPGVMTTDTLVARGGKLAELSEETKARLNDVLPPMWSHGNPVDILGDAGPDRYAQATEIVLQGENSDGVLIILTPQAMTDPTETARAIAEKAKRANKPILAAWMGADAVEEGVRILNEAGIPTYRSPERAVNAFMYLVDYARNIEALYETPREIPIELSIDESQVDALRRKIVSLNTDIVPELESKSLLEMYGIPSTLPVEAATADAAVDAAAVMGYPVVLKVLSPDITHKTDVGGVSLNLRNADNVRESFEHIQQRVASARPDARFDGVTVQRMVRASDSVELILGVKKDPVAGSVLMVGSGGIAAELYRDRALGLPPLTERLAMRMLEHLKLWPILKGYRGKPAMNVDKLVEVLMRLSYLVAEAPAIEELDINPLLVTPDEVIALDARIVVEPKLIEVPPPRYSHLTIRPYPTKYIKQVTLTNDMPATLRPIKPEDEPMWHVMLASCGAESIRMRFSSLFNTTTHDMAARYCYIDYDREMAIVAEVEENGERKLVGVGRLVSDPDHHSAEYAILVTDTFQNMGVGRLLTDYCIQIAKDWNLKHISAITSRNNRRMVHIFSELGFTVEHSPEDDVVQVEKTVASQERMVAKKSLAEV
jgi:acetyltransferase